MQVAVIFDVDGVLVRTDEAHYQSWQYVMDRAGISFDQHVNKELLGVSRRESLRIILDRAEATVSEADQAKLAAQKNERFQEFLAQLSPQDVLPGARERIEELRARHVPVAAGSSSRNATRILKLTDLAPLFDVTVDGNDIQHSKPNPEVFQKCAAQLKIAPAQCVVIEDAAAGVAAARAAGMKVIAVRDATHPIIADMIIDGLDAVSVDQILEQVGLGCAQ